MASDLVRNMRVLAVLCCLTTACGDDENASPMGPEGDTTLQMPLSVGNRWNQRVVETASTGLGADTTTVWSTITGTVERDGVLYFTLMDSSRFGVETSYLRQSGNELFTEFEIPFPDEPEVARTIVELIESSMPWKVAQFGAPEGAQWSLASIDTTLILEGSAWDVSFEIAGSSRGTSSVTVPAGSWPDAQIFHLSLAGTAGITGFPSASQSTDQDVWIVDGVGIVKEVSVDTFDSSQGSFTVESTSELVDFELQSGRSEVVP